MPCPTTGANSRNACAAAERRWHRRKACANRPGGRPSTLAGTLAALAGAMTTKIRPPGTSNVPSEAWTVPLLVIVYTTMMVGFIMACVVLLMR